MNARIALKLFLFFLLFLNTFGFAQLSAIIRDSVVEDAYPGDVIQAKITIVNPIEKEVFARIYLADYQDSIEGERYLEANSTSRSNASWISFGTNELVVPPNTTIEIPVEITIPTNSNIQGSYWSMVIVEAEAKTIVEADPTKEGIEAFGVEVVNRHALNVITTVGDGFADLNFSNPQIISSELEEKTFSINAENVGNRIATANVYLDIYSTEGVTLGRIDSGRHYLRPENPINFTFDFQNVVNLIADTNTTGSEMVSLAPGTYSALMIVDAGGDELFGARYNLELEE